MPLISHGGGRRYVIALSGKSLNNSHPTAALATKLGRRYIVSFPRLSFLSNRRNLFENNASRPPFFLLFYLSDLTFEIFGFQRFIYFLSNNRLIVKRDITTNCGNAKEENVMEADWTVTSNNFANHTATDQRNNWNSARCRSVTARIC